MSRLVRLRSAAHLGGCCSPAPTLASLRCSGQTIQIFMSFMFPPFVNTTALVRRVDESGGLHRGYQRPPTITVRSWAATAVIDAGISVEPIRVRRVMSAISPK